MPTMNYSCLYLSRYGRINFVVKLQRFVTERVRLSEVHSTLGRCPGDSHIRTRVRVTTQLATQTPSKVKYD